MAQLSRPYQVVIVLVAVIALAWFTVLHSHLSPSSSGSSSAGSSHSSSAAQAGATAHKPTKVYHGPVPGLKGLSKDINKAHEAVATANAQAQRAESGKASTAPSVQASTAQRTSSAHAASPAAATKAHSHRSASHAATRSHARASHSSQPAPTRPRHHAAAVSPAAKVAGQLHDGKVVLLLFWKRSSFDDQAVHSQVQAASRALRRKVAADYAKPSEVGAFGTVTRDVSVVQTPTLLVINRKGLVTTITGLTDAFAIEQAVREAER